MYIEDDFPGFGFDRRHRGRNGGPTRSSVGGPPCPTCGTRNTAVTDSRPIEGGQKRRRRCLEREACPRWNTVEYNGEPGQIGQTVPQELSKTDQNRVLRIIETADALRKSLKIPK